MLAAGLLAYLITNNLRSSTPDAHSGIIPSMRGAWLIAAATLMALTGCSTLLDPQGVLVPPGHESLRPCPIRVIAADDLDAQGEPGCDLTGSSIAIDVMNFEIATIGASVGHCPSTGLEYQWNNWGIPGVGVAKIVDGQLVTIWASTPQAKNLQQQQFDLR